jgi:uncharacterized OB-fold protein
MSDCKLETKTFFQAIENEVLIGSRCLSCGHISIPQRYICSRCHSTEAERLEFVGTGKLAAFTVIYVPATEMMKAGYDSKNPYMLELSPWMKVRASALRLWEWICQILLK